MSPTETEHMYQTSVQQMKTQWATRNTRTNAPLYDAPLVTADSVRVSLAMQLWKLEQLAAGVQPNLLLSFGELPEAHQARLLALARRAERLLDPTSRQADVDRAIEAVDIWLNEGLTVDRKLSHLDTAREAIAIFNSLEAR